MPIATVLRFIKSQVEQVQPPGLPGVNGPLATYVAPPDPDESGIARAYVWPATGREKRLAIPRNTGPRTPAGWKSETHQVMVWPLWFDDLDRDRLADINFPGMVDAIMDALRTCVDPVEDPAQGTMAQDPFTGRESAILNAGEEMSYDITTLRSTADQRIVIFQGAIRVPVVEYFQA